MRAELARMEKSLHGLNSCGLLGSNLDFSMVVLALPAEKIHLQRSGEVTMGAHSKRAEHKPRPHLLEQLVLMVLELPHGDGLPSKAGVLFLLATGRFAFRSPDLPPFQPVGQACLELSACRRTDLLY